MTTLINTYREQRHVYKVKKNSRLPSLNICVIGKAQIYFSLIRVSGKNVERKIYAILQEAVSNFFYEFLKAILFFACANIATFFIHLCFNKQFSLTKRFFPRLPNRCIKTIRFSMCLHDTTEIKCRFFKGPQPSCVYTEMISLLLLYRCSY